MKSLKYYLKKAQKQKWAVGQFNFSDLTQVKGIVAAAQKMRSPVILGTSEGESKFFGLQEAVAIRNVLRKKTGLPIFLNLDHAKSFEYAKEAINAGYDMVHFDGSKMPLEENIKDTKRVVSYASWRGVLVEGEVGRIKTDASKLYAEKFEVNEDDLTKPHEAKEYMAKTKADLLAVSIGNFHGIEISGICPNFKLNLLEKISKEAKNPMMVLHGGSGTLDDEVKEAIRLGIVKVNINTEIRLAFSGNLRRVLKKDEEEITPYKFLPDAQNSVGRLVERKISLFGSGGKA